MTRHPEHPVSLDNNQGKEICVSQPLPDPYHSLTLTCVIENLRGSLGGAIDHLSHDEYRSALGALLYFDEQVEDVAATIRLFRRALQKAGRRI